MRLLVLLLAFPASACSIPVQGPVTHDEPPLAVSYSAPLVEPLYPLHVNPGPFDPATVQAALNDWNRALGRVVLVLDVKGGVVLSEGDCAEADDDAAVGCAIGNRIELLPGEIRSQNTLRHELGHILGGKEHSAVGLMAAEEWSPRWQEIQDVDILRVQKALEGL